MVIDELYKILGLKIKQARRRSDFSQEELANFCNLRRSSITNIEVGRQAPPLHVIFNIAEALKVNPKDLIPDPGEKYFDDQELLDEIAVLMSGLSEEGKQKLRDLQDK